MNNEKWLHEAGGSVLRDDLRRSQQFRSKKAKALYPVAGVLLMWFLILYFPKDKTSLLANWIPRVVPGVGEKNAGEKIIYDFNDITPSTKLQWHPCFNNAKCARLTVPMDYNRPLSVSKDNPKVHVALAMIPGVGHIETGNYSASPLLINPGGPGGAGAFFALGIGSMLQSVVSTDKSQDVIGFDPRGIGATTPRADCWSYPSNGKDTTDEDIRTGAFNSWNWAIMGAEIPLINATESALGQRDSRARAAAKLCKQHDDMKGENSILRHMSTPAVAQDMLSIIDAWDEWRVVTGQVDSEMAAQTTDNEMPDKTAHSLETRGKLVYWGFSYGTLLGATFAAMFPQRVGRVVLDGVVDADGYVSPTWAGSLRDTDKVEETFYHYCQKAGSSCALYRANDTKDDIKARVQDVFQSLKEQPFSGVSPYSNLPFSFTDAILKQYLFSSLYSPIHAFPGLAQLLSALHLRNEQAILNLLPVFYIPYQAFCDNSEPIIFFSQDAQLAVMCSDKRYPLNETLPNLKHRFESLACISHFADIWMSLMIGCDAYDITPTDPPMRWDDHPAHRQTPINTSFPLMFVSNSGDPVTPLAAGVKMAKKFVGAGLLEQRGEGHCSIAAVSRCTLEKLRAYFEDGVVPAGPKGQGIEDGGWERCEVDEWPWKPFTGEAWMSEFEKKLRSGETAGGAADVQVLREEELNAVRRMEDWKVVRKFADAFLRPRGMNGGSLIGRW